MTAAIQLFVMAGLRDNASTCKSCMDAQIKVIETGPSGLRFRLGTGAVCWGCGSVGLPRNPECFDGGKVKTGFEGHPMWTLIEP